MNRTAANRLVDYILNKLETEPVASRADLYEDLADFLPSEAMACQLREQAQTLRDVEKRAHAIKLAMRFSSTTAPAKLS
ncbi:hypothetical protein [Ruficoccus sp. ZRK36]|uniref:hypothetical protein n=1 Tax=Ruficoccus sp. ZRK36 TaxID=2866311 RepID=UPI001C73A779|nr:hypothetical protein [Ruficoccus sp. ZRK36]QYY35185.1 hypothetical protein K0V07_12870 [Ruficoccus sp. ZRK36]